MLSLTTSMLLFSMMSVLTPIPSCPFSFVPHVQTVPFSFNATTNSSPAFIFGVATPAFVTFTIIYVLYPFSVSVILTLVCPTFIAVIFPTLSTVAIFSPSDSNVIFPKFKSSV